jgi:hypothetical protein
MLVLPHGVERLVNSESRAKKSRLLSGLITLLIFVLTCSVALEEADRSQSGMGILVLRRSRAHGTA